MAKGKVSKNGPTMKVNWNRIEALLKNENITGQELSKMLGYSKWYLSSSKNSKMKGLPFDVIKQISDMFSVKFEDLLAEATTDEHENKLEDVETLDTAKKSLQEKAAKLAFVTDGEDTMMLQFSEDEFRHIVTLTKHFKLQITTDLFHKLLDDAWKVYYLDRVRNELRYLSEEELEKRVVNIAMGRKKYGKDDLIRKLIDYAMSEKH